MTDEALQILLVKVVDGVASPAEREALMAAAIADPALRRELDAHLAMKAVTDGWVKRLEHDLVQDRVEAAPTARIEQGVGLSLLFVGTALLLGGAPVALFQDPEVPLWLSLGFSALAAGGLLLLVAVIRWRWQTAAHDPYTEIRR